MQDVLSRQLFAELGISSAAPDTFVSKKSMRGICDHLNVQCLDLLQMPRPLVCSYKAKCISSLQIHHKVSLLTLGGLISVVTCPQCRTLVTCLISQICHCAVGASTWFLMNCTDSGRSENSTNLDKNCTNLWYLGWTCRAKKELFQIWGKWYHAPSVFRKLYATCIETFRILCQHDRACRTCL